MAVFGKSFLTVCARTFLVFWFVLSMVGSQAVAQVSYPYVTNSKQICIHDTDPSNACVPLPSPSIHQLVMYEFSVDNMLGTAGAQINFSELYPTQFTPLTPTGATDPIICTDSTGASVALSMSAGTPSNITLSNLPADLITCRFHGYFNQPGVSTLNQIEDDTAVVVADVPVTVSSNPVLPVDYALSKEILPTTTLPLTVPSLTFGDNHIAYRITLEGAGDAIIGPNFLISDQMGLAAGAAPMGVSFVSTPTCKRGPAGNATQNVPCTMVHQGTGPLGQQNAWNDLMQVQFDGPAFILPDAEVIEIDFVLEIAAPDAQACVLDSLMSIYNRAFVTFANGAVAFNDPDNSNNMAGFGGEVEAQVQTNLQPDPDCPLPTDDTPPPAEPSPLKITKEAVDGTGPYAWGQGNQIDYVITLENTGSVMMHDILLTDIVQNLAFTPNFQVQLLDINILTCNTSCSVVAPTSLAGPVGSIQHYTDFENMAEVKIDEIAPGDGVEIHVGLTYFKPHCDTAPDYPQKLIRNAAIANFKYQSVNDPDVYFNGIGTAIADVEMEKVEACEIKTFKRQISDPDHVIFGQPTVYEVGFINGGDQTLNIGSLIDSMRLEQPNYASSLTATYSFQCSQNGGVSGYQSNGTGQGFVSYVGQANQGLRIMDHPGFVTFPPNSELICEVHVTLSPPPATDQFCFSNINEVPSVQNTAIMDQALYYNSNLPFPTGPQNYNWDTTRSELPRCYRLALNKTATPPTTGPQGPAINYTITVHNPSASGSPDGDIDFPLGSVHGWAIRDQMTTVPAPLTTITQDPCDGTQVGVGCTWTAPYTGLTMNKLAADSYATWQYSAAPNPEFTPHEVCNTVKADYMLDGGNFDTDRWYLHPESVLEKQICVQIRNKVHVTKEFDLPAGEALPSGLSIDVSVTCTHSDFPNFPVRTLTLNDANNWSGFAWTPVGATCQVQEQQPAQVLPSHCTWEDALYAPSQSITTDSSANDWYVTVTNPVSCEYGDVTINKQVNPSTGGPQIPAGFALSTPPANSSYTIDMTCADGQAPDPDLVHSVTFGAQGGSEVVPNVPAGLMCSVVETLPTAEDGCQWLQSLPQDLTVAANTANRNLAVNSLNVVNSYVCEDSDYTQFDIVKRLAFVGPQPAGPLDFSFNIGCDIGGVPSPNPATISYPADFNNNTYGTETIIVTGAGTNSANCSVTEVLPTPPAGCSWALPFYTFTTNTAVGGSITAQSLNSVEPDGSSTNKLFVTNRLTCTGITTGKLDITKTINQGTPTPGFVFATPPAGTTYDVSAMCGSAGTSSLTFPANGGTQSLSGLQDGANCTIAETINSPVTEFGCQWRKQISPISNTIVGGATGQVNVNNIYECRAVTKRCDPIPAGSSLPYTIDCEIDVRSDPSHPNPGWFWVGDIYLGLDASGGVTPITASMTMTSNDLSPIVCLPNPMNSGVGFCLGETQDLSATINATITVTDPQDARQIVNCAIEGDAYDGDMPNFNNRSAHPNVNQRSPFGGDQTPSEICPIIDLPEPPKETGRLRIRKSVNRGVNKDPNLSVTPPPSNTSYNFDVTCTGGNAPTGTYQTTIANAMGGSATLLGIPAGQTCSATETISGNSSSNCHWETTMQPVTVPANGVATLSVQNMYLCRKDGGFNLRKVVTPAVTLFSNRYTPRTPPAGTTYDMTVSCIGANGSPIVTTHSFPSGGGAQLIAANIMAGDTCTVTENPLPPAADNCRWRTSYSPANGTVVASPLPNPSATVTVTNTYECKPSIIQISLPTRFDVVKTIHPDSEAVPLGVDFGFNITNCTNSGTPSPSSVNLEYTSDFAGSPLEGRRTVTVSLPAGSSATGSSCTVTETPLNPTDLPKGCRWAAPEYSTDDGQTWSSTPAQISGVSFFRIGVPLPSVHVRNRVMCKGGGKPTLEMSKRCKPNPITLSEPGEVDVKCEISISGQNLPPNQLILVSDVMTSLATGDPVVIDPNSFVGTGTPDFTCGVQNAPPEISCGVSSSVLNAQGSISTVIEFTALNLWETGSFENCVQGRIRAPGTVGRIVSNQACDKIIVKKDDPKPKPSPKLGLKKYTTGACEADRGSQQYTCGFGFEVSNTGDAPFQGPLAFTDVFTKGPAAQGVKLRRGAGWECLGTNGSEVSCLNGTAQIEPGQSQVLSLSVTLPGLEKGGSFCNAASFGASDDPFTQTIIVQKAMALLGIEAGPADGKDGPQTRKGVQQLQEALGLEASGVIDGALLQSLGLPEKGTSPTEEVCVTLPPMPKPVLACNKRTTFLDDGGESCSCKYNGMKKLSKTKCACRPGTKLVPGVGCRRVEKPKCDAGTTRVNGVCVPLRCDPKTTVDVGGSCVCRNKSMRKISPTQCR